MCVRRDSPGPRIFAYVPGAIADTQMPPALKGVCDEQLALYDLGRTVQQVNAVPDTDEIPSTSKPRHWLRIPDVTCVFVDMKGSTKLSASTADRATAGAYQLFTGTAVRIFDALDAPYIDVRGDGAFALFDRGQEYRALVAAVTVKTFSYEIFIPTVRAATQLEIASHIGVDRKTVLVRKIGMRTGNSRTDRQNEVWAGKPVNMAAKLAGLADAQGLWVSDRFFEMIPDDRARISCESGVSLWETRDVAGDDRFDFDVAQAIKTNGWCKTHGRDYVETLLALDDS